MPLTPKQEMLVRNFYTEVLHDDSLFSGDATATRKHASMCCMALLGYVVRGGAHVKPEDLHPTPYGQPVTIKDRWEEDTAACMEALNEANSSTDTDEADNSESTTDTEVREAVLPEDV